ncbi:hypothetical protein [Streptomyces sp. NPDC058867]|uniref:sodium:solute symporter family transporter n=1 Tax=unclassified Streptomyces TaxID=2593676 RepID=UPI0036A35B08
MNSLALSGGGVITPFVAFTLVVVFSFLLCLIVGMDNDDLPDFLAANRKMSTLRNSFALFGDSLSATVFLSAVGGIAFAGFRGMVAVAALVAAFGILQLLAEPVRALKGYTLGDLLNGPLASPAVRIAAAVVTLMVCVPILVVQLTVAGDVTAYVTGLERNDAAKVCTILIGVLIPLFAAFGGMRGISLIQIGKSVLVLGAVTVLVYAVLQRADWDLGAVVEKAGQQSGGHDIFYSDMASPLADIGKADLYSLGLTSALGAAVLPHILLRINSFRDARGARLGSLIAMGATLVLAVGIVLVGLSAAATVGGAAILGEDPSGYAALFMLSDTISGRGGIVLTVVSVAVLLTAVSTASGITIAGAAGIAHDLYSQVWKKGRVAEDRVVRLTRWSIVGIGLVSVYLAVELKARSILFVSTFALTVAASTILPALVYRLYWKRFTRPGLLLTLYGPLVCSVVLQAFSPAVSGNPSSLFPSADFDYVPLYYVTVVTVPVGFFLGWAGSLLTRGSATAGPVGAHRRDEQWNTYPV